MQVPQDPKDPTRADRTLPPQLCIAQSKIPHAGRGVWTRVLLKKGLRFGPYEGAIVENNNTNGYGWQVHQCNGVFFIKIAIGYLREFKYMRRSNTLKQGPDFYDL